MSAGLGIGESGLPGALLGLALVVLVAVSVLLARLAVVAVIVVVARAAPRHRRPSAGRAAVRCCPRLLRPMVVAALGTTLAALAAAPAGATTTTSAGGAVTTTAPQLPAAGWADAAPEQDPSPLPSAGWVASRPAAPAVPPHLVSSTPSRQGAADIGTDTGTDTGGVVVRHGDTLWSLAARQLGPDASDAEIAAWWPRWWKANRALIGSDPDRLLPGTRLLAPQADPR